MLKKIAKHKIIIEKTNGQVYKCDYANVQPETVFIYCPEIPLEEGDLIKHKISEENIQEFVVIDRGYYDQILEPHYQAKVMRRNEYEKLKEKEEKININSNNSQININANGNSFNLTYNFKNIPFNEIREKLNEIPDEAIKNDSLKYLEKMEKSEDEETFKINYSKLLSTIANFITILTPIVTLISSYI